MIAYDITYDRKNLSFETKKGTIMSRTEILKKLEGEHQELQFNSFSNTRALEIGLELVRIAKEREYPVAIEIRRSGQILFHYACDGASIDNDDWLLRKSRVSLRFGKSSLYVKEFLREKGESLEGLYFIDPMEYSASGGSFPIFIRNTGPVGTVSVSGLPDVEDHELIVSVLREFVRADAE